MPRETDLLRVKLVAHTLLDVQIQETAAILFFLCESEWNEMKKTRNPWRQSSSCG